MQQWDGRSNNGNGSWRTLPFTETGIGSYTVTFSGSSAVVSGLADGIGYSHRVRTVQGSEYSSWTAYVNTYTLAAAAAPTHTPTPTASPTSTHTPAATHTPTSTPSSSVTASLSPDPSTVNFRPDGSWRRFTVNSSATIRVYVNPGSTPRNVEVSTSNAGNHCSNGAEREGKSRRNGQYVYLAGCNSGTGTVQLQTSSGSVIRTYTFSIGATATATHTSTATHTATHTPTSTATATVTHTPTTMPTATHTSTATHTATATATPLNIRAELDPEPDELPDDREWFEFEMDTNASGDIIVRLNHSIATDKIVGSESGDTGIASCSSRGASGQVHSNVINVGDGDEVYLAGCEQGDTTIELIWWDGSRYHFLRTYDVEVVDDDDYYNPDPTPTRTRTPRATATHTPTATPTSPSGPANTPTHTNTPTPTSTTVPGATATFTPTATATPTVAEELDTAIALIGELHSAVSGHIDYMRAEAALSTCLRDSTGGATGAAVTPFNDILSNYNAHKSKIEPGGVCGTQGTAMFAAIKSLSASELATLKSNNAAYAALLSTTHGRAFERSVGNADVIKLYATLASPQASGGASGDGASGAAPVNPTPVSRVGVNCLPHGDTADTVAEKIGVLNCLIFDTPRSFWVTQSTKTKTGNDLAGASDDRYDFLGLGDWGCSKAPDVPFLASCLKHDVAYSSLKNFVPGISLPAIINFDKDSTWHPRNKYLADLTLEIDLMEDTENWQAPPESCTSLLPDASMSLGRDADSAYLAYVVCRTYNTQTATYARAEIMYFVLSALYPPVVWSPSTSDIIDVFWNPRYVIDATQE